MLHRRLALFILLTIAAAPLMAASPPDLINFQGILRDGADDARNGPVDMTFRFFDADTGGNQLLIDEHLASGSGAVTVDDGLFNVAFGSGTLSDGGSGLPNAPYGSLSEVFRDFSEVWVEIVADDGGGAETLTPRIRVTAGAYALNADRLDGMDASGFVDTSAAAQVKPGTLTLNRLNVGLTPGTTNEIEFGNGALIRETNTGQLKVRAGNAFLDLEVDDGGSPKRIFSINPSSTFVRSQMTLTDEVGSSISIADTTMPDEESMMKLSADKSSVTLTAGDIGDGTETLDLQVANNGGGITVNGGADVVLRSGDGDYVFRNDAGADALTVDADSATTNVSLTVTGDDLEIVSDDAELKLTSGAATPSLTADVGGDQAFAISNANMFLRRDLTIVDATTSNVRFRGSTTSDGRGIVSSDDDSLSLTAGDDATDTLSLRAGDADGNGRIILNGQGTTEIRSGDGSISFRNDGTSFTTATLDATGTFTATADLASLGTKTFIQNHPYRDDLTLAYVALEGDEVATFTRGSARLENGIARVELGETFAWVTNPDLGLTATVTPRGGWSDLYVESISTTELVVRSRDGEITDVAFDYLVFGLRIGYEDYPIVRSRIVESTVPARAHYDRLYEHTPDLRRFSAAKRYPAMHAAVHDAEVGEMSAARELRQAIGEHDRAIERGMHPANDASRARLVTEGPAPAEGVSDAAGPRSGSPVHRFEAGAAAQVVPATKAAARRNLLTALVDVGESVEPGDVLVVGAEGGGRMALGRSAADPAVAGIVAVDPAADSGDIGANRAAIAVSGVVTCKVDAGFGEIRPGDLLTTSPTPGHAMRSHEAIPGTIIGKALESHDLGTGTIRVMVWQR